MKRSYFMAAAVVLSFLIFASCNKVLPSEPGVPTATATITLSHTVTDTWTASPTVTDTPTVTETGTVTATPAITEAVTSSPTETITPTNASEPPASTCSFGADAPLISYGYSSGSMIRLGRFSTATQITVAKIAFYIVINGAWTSGAASAAIYTNSAADEPETKLAGSTGTTAMTGAGWNTVNMPSTVLEPGEYWLGVEPNVFGGLGYDIPYAEGLGYVWGGTAWPDTWSGGTVGQTAAYTIMAVCE